MATIPGPVQEPRVTTSQIIQTSVPLAAEAALPATIIGLHQFVSYKEAMGSFVGGLSTDTSYSVTGVADTSATILSDYSPPSAIRLSDGVRVTPATLPQAFFTHDTYGEIAIDSSEITVTPSTATLTLDKNYSPTYTTLTGTNGAYSEEDHLLLTISATGPADGETLILTDGTLSDTYTFKLTPVASFDVDISGSPTIQTILDRLTTVIRARIADATANLTDIRVHRLPGTTTLVIESLTALDVSVGGASTATNLADAAVRLFTDSTVNFLNSSYFVETGDLITLSDTNVFDVEVVASDAQLFVQDNATANTLAASDDAVGQSYTVTKTLTGSDVVGDIALTYVARRTDRTTEIINVDTTTFTQELGQANPANPLGMAVAIGLRNTLQQIQALQLTADTVAGHDNAMEVLSNYETPYGLVPLNASGTILSSWKTHADLMSTEGQNGERVLWRQAELVIQEDKVDDLTQWETPVVALPTITFNVAAGGDNDEFQDVVVGDLVTNSSTGESGRIVAITPGATATDPYVLTIAQPTTLVDNLRVTFGGVPVDQSLITITDGVNTDIYEFDNGGVATTPGAIAVDTVSGTAAGVAAAFDAAITASGTVTLTQAYTPASTFVDFAEFTDSRVVTVTETDDTGGAITITGEAWNNWVVQSQALTRDEQATAIATNSANIDCRRVMNMWPDEIQLVFSDDSAGPSAGVTEGIWGGGDLIWEDCPGYFQGAIYAALRSQVSTGVPLAGRQAVGVYNLEKTTPYFTRTQLQRILSTGTWLSKQPTPNGGTIHAVRGVTTDDTSSTTVEEMVTAAVDEFAKEIRLATSGLFDGSRVLDAQGNFLQDFGIGVQSVVDRFLDPTNARARDISILAVFEDPNDAGTVILDVDFVHLTPANRGRVRIYVRSNQTQLRQTL